MDWRRCEIANSEVYIGRHLAKIGLANVRYEGNHPIKLTTPSPPQEYLTTTITDCDSDWFIHGHTNLEIKGNEILSGCHAQVYGIDTVNATITVDFGIFDSSCSGTYSVELDGEVLTINDSKAIEFGTAFKNFNFIMSPCDDRVHIKRMPTNTSSVLIKGGAGNGK